MFNQNEIENVLQQAQAAVDELSTLSNNPPPAGAVAPLEPRAPRAARPATAVSANDPIARLLHIRVPVIVRLAHRRMRVSEITRITVGAILEFDRSVNCELELLINNKCIGTGEAVKVDECFGLKVNYVGDVRARIQSLRN